MATQVIARFLPQAGGRRVGSQAVATLLVVAVAAALAWFLSGHRALLGVTALVMVGGALWFASTRQTQLALALVMVYLGALDGYLKLSTGSTLVTFVRDILLYALVVGLLVRAVAERKPLPLPPLGGWVLAFVVLVLVQLFNPQDGSLLHSLGGVKQSLEFVPLFFLTYAYVRTKKALIVFAVLLAALGAANGIVDVIQFKESPAQLASWGTGYAERVDATGAFAQAGRIFFDANNQEHVRPFGLMSDAGSGGLVAAFALGCILALSSLKGRRRYIPLAVLTAAAAIAGIVTSEGRAVIVCSFVVVLAYGILTATSRGRLTTAVGIGLLCAAAYVAASLFVSGQATRYSGLNLSQIGQTANQSGRSLALQSIPSNMIHYPLGSGLGTAGPAVGQSGAPAAAMTANAENEISFAVLETGIPGMVVIIGFTIALFVLGFRRCRQEPDHDTRLLLAAIIAPIAGMLVLYAVGSVTPTTPGGPYLWAVGGIVSYWLIERPAKLRQSTTTAGWFRAPGQLLWSS